MLKYIMIKHILSISIMILFTTFKYLIKLTNLYNISILVHYNVRFNKYFILFVYILCDGNKKLV